MTLPVITPRLAFWLVAAGWALLLIATITRLVGRQPQSYKSDPGRRRWSYGRPRRDRRLRPESSGTPLKILVHRRLQGSECASRTLENAQREGGRTNAVQQRSRLDTSQVQDRRGREGDCGCVGAVDSAWWSWWWRFCWAWTLATWRT